MSRGITYKDAGVDTKEGERAVGLMKSHVKKTFTPAVLTGLGSFGGLFKPDISGMKEPVLVSGADGVGTKLKIAFALDKHDTVGIDCVAMCVNDILCQGATPLFFLDYIATGKVTAEKIEQIIKGISEGCIQGQSALLGGETAEMPGFYNDGEYDMAGFAVGIVDREKIITGKEIKAGEKIIALLSSGIHSNGYSLVRKIFLEEEKEQILEKHIEELGMTLGEALLEPTRIYAKQCKALFNKENINISGIVHVTGGGFYENIPRILPQGIAVKINTQGIPRNKIFDIIQKKGNVSMKEMYSTFNMGVGMLMVMDEISAKNALDAMEEIGEKAYIIGETFAINESVTNREEIVSLDIDDLV